MSKQKDKTLFQYFLSINKFLNNYLKRINTYNKLFKSFILVFNNTKDKKNYKKIIKTILKTLKLYKNIKNVKILKLPYF